MPLPSRRRAWSTLCLLALVALLAGGCASTGKPMQALDRVQYAWSAAVRWNDFDSAWQLVDPEWRQAHPLTAQARERYRQIQVTGYTERGGGAVDATSATRLIDIAVVNRHTMAERTVRYTEHWRYDAAAGTWWITDGLPDLWEGE